jgi:acetyl esterase
MAQDAQRPPASRIGRRRAAAAEGDGENYHDRRAEIVTAAVALFRERGYRRTSLAEIGEAVGAERASLYYYFSSKEEILNEAVTPIVLRNTAIAEEIRDSAEPAPRQLRRLMTGLMQSFADNYPLLYMYLEENLSAVTKSQQAWAAEMRAVNRRYVGAIEQIIQKGIAAGTLRPIADPQILANGLMGLISWTHRWYNPDQSTIGASTIGAAYADLLVGGLEMPPVEVTDERRPAWLGQAHPDVARVVARFRAAGVPRYHELSVPSARAALENVVRLQAPELPLAEVRDLLVPGAGGSLPARLYHPDPGRALPLVVYVHGGGWVLGGIAPADRPCRRLAAAAGCAVVSIEYRRAPETKFPGPLDDCVDAVRWLAAHADRLGADGARVSVMGDSAGGNLVAAAVRRLRDEGGPPLAGQILVYPCLVPPGAGGFASYEQYAEGPLMSKAEMQWFWGHYLRSEADGRDPAAAPLLAGDLAGLPPATVVVAELDPLRDEGLAYAERLRAAGVPTEVEVYRGAAHGFWWMDGEMRQSAELTERLARQLRRPGTP